MSFFDKLLEVGTKVVNGVIDEGMKNQSSRYKEAESKFKRQSVANSQNSDGRPIKNPFAIGDKSLEEWERQWRNIGILSSLSLTQYNNDVGVYRARLNGKIIYIGRAIEWSNGGFRKRLSDYTRDSDSARKHRSGQKMYEHRNELSIEIIVTGSNEESAEVAGKLESRLIVKYQPEWNVKINI